MLRRAASQASASAAKKIKNFHGRRTGSGMPAKEHETGRAGQNSA